MIGCIVNADDFGLMDCVTRAIADSFTRRLITQTTLMVNMPNCEDAVALARSRGFADRIGLHLNLTYGRPLTDGIRNSPLFCDGSGMFSGRFHNSKYRRLVLPRREQKWVELEVGAQMEKYLDLGLPLLHLDSHHHSHTDYSVARIALPFAQRLGFKSVRLSRNAAFFSTPKRVYKACLNGFLRKGFVHTDYFGSFGDFSRFRSRIPNGASVEIMVHPVYRDMRVRTAYVPGNDFVDYEAPTKDWERFMRETSNDVQFRTFADLQCEKGKIRL